MKIADTVWIFLIISKRLQFIVLDPDNASSQGGNSTAVRIYFRLRLDSAKIGYVGINDADKVSPYTSFSMSAN